VSKERRLGRGLEALLGQLPGWSNPPTPGQPGTPGPMSPPQPIQPFEVEGAVASQDFSPPAIEPMPAQQPATPPPPAEALSPPGQDATQGPARLDIGLIDSNPFQPRQEFTTAEMQALADSLAAHGLLQPVVVRRAGDRYQLIAGERRLRAAVQAGWTDVPVVVVEADDRQTAEMAIVENMQRKDLNPLEKAASFQRYLQKFGCTQEELAGRLGLDRSTVTNFIRLLELPEPVQDALRRGRITQGHARALLPLGEEREQVAFAQRIQDEGLNVRQTESMVQEIVAGAKSPPLGVIDREGKQVRTGRTQSEHLASLEQQFRAALGVKVSISHNAKGRGKVVIHFDSHEEFERLRQYICEPARPSVQAG